MQQYAESLLQYKRLKTKEVIVGGLLIGNYNPIRIQTMTTTDTMNTLATVEQSIRCIEAGAELVRITAPSKNEAENLQLIKDELRKRGYNTPLVADIHFTPNAAEIAARIVEKVRVNPGNYVDKKKFDIIEYTDADYAEEIERIQDRFTPLVKICKEYGTAMRIGTNHGSLSDRIMSRYGDTPIGMVESAMEFLRIARFENYHNIILSMKSSNPQVMVQAYRMLVETMHTEFGECYPLHLGVTEAGDGEDGRIKSAVGIGTLLEDGLGDTIRVSLTEDPELELPVCKLLVKKYENIIVNSEELVVKSEVPIMKSEKSSVDFSNLKTSNLYTVIADTSKIQQLQPSDLTSIGYTYNTNDDKWTISDMAADYIFCNEAPHFALPGTLDIITYHAQWIEHKNNPTHFPLLDALQYLIPLVEKSTVQNFVMLDANKSTYTDEVFNRIIEAVKKDNTVVLCLSSTEKNAMQCIRNMCNILQLHNVNNPVVIITDSNDENLEQALIHYSVEAGALLLDNYIKGVCFGFQFGNNNYTQQEKLEQITTINSIAFGILQATRKRISKTEYISCPSCGRTLFDLQETTAKIRAVTNHLKGVKIAIMGCIVNGPGEMADADFGYVGSGVDKITLYKGKEVVKKALNSDVAVDELINLIKESGAWVEVA
jgi:(E)-4-hydroxy-3-methylbut-2-enyl-diphosphate synthase